MTGEIFLTVKQADRLGMLKLLEEGKLNVPEVAQALFLSERHIFRMKGEFEKCGAVSLIHKNRGRKPAHAIPDDVRERVLELMKDDLQGANLTHTAELLSERYKIVLSSKSVGRIASKAGISRSRSRCSPKRYRRRKRRSFEGELIQLDASQFEWIGEGGPIWHLHGAIDDATGKILGLSFQLSENTFGYFEVLRQILQGHGIPRTFYSDRHAIFVPTSADKPTIQEQLEGKQEPITQFGKVLGDLGIGHIEALSPQAKGRIERLWGTLQDRLVIELRLAKVSTLEEAEKFLSQFISRFNKRFSIQAAESTTVFRHLPPGTNLKHLLSCRYERLLSNDSTISFEGVSYSLVDSNGKIWGGKKGKRIRVLEHMDGRFSASHEGNIFGLVPWQKPVQSDSKPAKKKEIPEKEKEQNETPKDHPWKRGIVINPRQTQILRQGTPTSRPGAAGRQAT